jgi:hypothetical protein
MPTTMERDRTRLPQNLASILLLALGIAGCSGPSKETPPPTVDLSPFREVARSSECADIKNRLFLIDGTLVLWDRQGNCPDASYLVRLSGGTVDNVLCELQDSIAGPRKECPDGQYEQMFDTITENLDKPDLGLGSEHTVTPVTL